MALRSVVNSRRVRLAIFNWHFELSLRGASLLQGVSRLAIRRDVGGDYQFVLSANFMKVVL